MRCNGIRIDQKVIHDTLRRSESLHLGFNAISDCAEVIERMAERLLATDAAASAPLDPQAARELQARFGQLVSEIESAAVAAGRWT